MTVPQLPDLVEPTVVEVSAPWCSACRAMRSDLADVVAEYDDRVNFIEIDVAVHGDDIAAWGVRGTPTLIGLRNGEERFRVAGRRSISELRDLFAATVDVQSDAVGRIARREAVLRGGAGGVVAVVGVAAGPAWPLVAVGALLAGYGAMTYVRGLK